MLRRIQTWLAVLGKSSYLSYGRDLHIGKGSRLWAPQKISIGDFVYIGKKVHIEANCTIGNYCLIANNVAIVGRHDHDFTAIGYPVRFAPWLTSKNIPNNFLGEAVVIGDDVWIGYGAKILTGVIIERGAIIAAGSIVTHDVAAYTIAAGVPAKVIGKRFANKNVIEKHERAIQDGSFSFSEKGYDYCIIKPALQKGAV